jgi:hypothetical protein
VPDPGGAGEVADVVAVVLDDVDDEVESFLSELHAPVREVKATVAATEAATAR